MFETSPQSLVILPDFQAVFQSPALLVVWPLLGVLLPIIALIIDNTSYFLFSFAIYKALKAFQILGCLDGSRTTVVILWSTLLQLEESVRPVPMGWDRLGTGFASTSPGLNPASAWN